MRVMFITIVSSFFLLLSSFGQAQETVTGTFTWVYDIPDTKDTQFQKVQVHFKYELFTEKIGDKYRVWAKYTFVPFGTKIWPERGGAYNYKYRGKWYNSDDMWRVDPRTNDGFMNTYGFIPNVQVTQVSMSGKIIGDKEAVFFAPISDNYHVTSTDLGYISAPKQLRTVTISVNNTKVNYISTSGTDVLQRRIADYEKKLAENKQYDEVIKKADAAFNSKKYSEAQSLYQGALNHRKNDSYAKKQLEESKRLAEEEKKKNQQAQTASSNDSFWDNTPASQTTQSNQTSQIPGSGRMTFEEQAASARRVTEEANRQAKEKLDNYFSSERTRLQNEQANKLNVLANSFYANEARGRAEQGISQNTSFERNFDNVEDLQRAFQEQVSAINQYSEDAYKARIQQNANNLEYNWGTSTGTDRAIGEVATGIANIVGSVRAEQERKEAIAKLEKERKAQIARIENERKQKILNLRTDIFRQFPEGGVPLSRHKVELDELYFFTYSQNADRTAVKVSNVFPYAKYKDGTWAFKDKVTAESEKTAGNKVTLVGYYTSKELAEKERNVFVSLLPQAEVQVTSYTVKGRKWDGATNGSTDFWGNESKTEIKATEEKTDDFWGDASAKTDKKTETKKEDDFWD